MANAKLNGPRYHYASIDTAPGSGGYWSDAVSMSKVNANQLFWSRSGEGLGTVFLQFQLPHTGAAWTDYISGQDLVDGERFRLDDMGAGVKWRTGIKEDTSADPITVAVSGTTIVGFDW